MPGAAARGFFLRLDKDQSGLLTGKEIGRAGAHFDANGDGRMDDLNSDSRIDTADARWLADLVEAVVAEHPPLAGGMSVYPANSRHGPFVHIDVRGMRVRW